MQFQLQILTLKMKQPLESRNVLPTIQFELKPYRKWFCRLTMAFILNDPPRPLFHRVVYRITQWVTLLIFKALFRFQYRHADRLPLEGGVLICPNHFSHLDPMAVGCIARRRVNFLAKKSLFDQRLFGWYLSVLHSIPIDREATGIGGMKETLKRLKKSEPVVMFPEGERSWDGNLLPLMKGFTALVKRVKVPIVPVGIHGTYETWPRGKSIPKPGRIKLVVGESIPFSQLAEMDEEQMAEFVGTRIAECYNEARQWNQ